MNHYEPRQSGFRARNAQAHARVPGHFGELLQGRIGPEGPIALVTLATEFAAVDAWISGPGHGVSMHGTELVSQARAAQFLDDLGLDPPGHVALDAATGPGRGCGISTAALLALATLAGAGSRGPRIGPEDLVRAAIDAEGATDPTMFPDPGRLLWSSRDGRLLGSVPPLPKCDIVGGHWGNPVRTDPLDTGFPDVSDLAAKLSSATSLSQMAAIATESASRCLAQRGPENDPTIDLARDLGALGVVMAHTGTARGLIFAPGSVPEAAMSAMERAGYSGIATFSAGTKE